MKNLLNFMKSGDGNNSIKAIIEKLVNAWTKVRAAIGNFFANEKISRFFSSKITSRIILFLVLFLALIQIVFGVLVYGFKSEDKLTRTVAKVIPFPVAIANQDFITYDDYLGEKDYIHHFYKATEQSNIDFAEVDKQIVDQLVENKLIGFQASVNKTKVSKSDVDTAVKDIVDQNGGEDKVNKVLADLYGLNLKQFRSLVKVQMIRDKLDQKMIARVTVNHILVRLDQNAPDEKVAEAKAKIEGYSTEIKGGLDFSEAAKKYSEDIGSAEQGGALEPFAYGEMVPEFSKAAFSTKVGEMSDPVRTEFGWHVIKVDAKTGTIEKSFGDWLGGLKKKSLIIKFIK